MNDDVSVTVQIAVLAIQLCVILFAARLCGMAMQRLRLPSVLGELLTGVLLGPYVLGGYGLPLHGLEQGLFPASGLEGVPVSPLLYSLATIGSVILLFMSGLETDLRMFFRYSVAGTAVGLGGVVFSYAFGVGLGMMMYDGVGPMDARCMFLGILCTATSVGITARILSERRSIDSPEGTTILAAAVIDDVLGIISLAIVMGLVGMKASRGAGFSWGHVGLVAARSFGLWLGVTVVGLVLAHKLAQMLKWFMPSKVFSVLALGLALGLAGIFEQAGLAMIVGAYVMGLCLSKTDISFSIQRHLGEIYNLLVPVFFVVMGMMVDVRVLGEPTVLKFGLLYSVLAILAKIIGCALPALFMNFNVLGAVRIGAGMVPRGEVALIIAGIGSTTMMLVDGERVPIVNAELFGIAIIMTLVTTILAPPLLSLVLSLGGKGVRRETAAEETVHSVYAAPSELFKEFILRTIQDNFRQEGFRHSELDSEGGIIRFRREGTTFSLQLNGNSFDFESSPNEALLIRTVMYETLVEINRGIAEMQSYVDPARFGKVVEVATDTKSLKTPLNLGRVIGPRNIILDLCAKTHDEALREMVMRLAEERLLTDRDTCLQDVLHREAIMSTCIAPGIALPHARTTGTEHLAAVVGISRKGIPATGGQEGTLTRIFVLSVCPKRKDQPYLQFVGLVASVLSGSGAIKTLLDADTEEDIRQFFIQRAHR